MGLLFVSIVGIVIVAPANCSNCSCSS